MTHLTTLPMLGTTLGDGVLGTDLGPQIICPRSTSCHTGDGVYLEMESLQIREVKTRRHWRRVGSEYKCCPYRNGRNRHRVSSYQED